jgi:hypothetical protein
MYGPQALLVAYDDNISILITFFVPTASMLQAARGEILICTHVFASSAVPFSTGIRESAFMGFHVCFRPRNSKSELQILSCCSTSLDGDLTIFGSCEQN